MDKYKTKIELLTDDEGEYINLKKRIGGNWVEASFYIDEIDVDKKQVDTIDEEFPFSCTISIPVYEKNITFKVKEINIEPIIKEMTIEEIEKELGYKVKIIN